MAFDDPSAPAEPARRLSIAPCREGWAIMHGDGFLGVSADREEAMRLLRTPAGGTAVSGQMTVSLRQA
jgi:hypothetical protein